MFKCTLDMFKQVVVLTAKLSFVDRHLVEYK